MLTSPLPDDHPVKNWNVEDVEEAIATHRKHMDGGFDVAGLERDWDEVRTRVSAIVGLKVVRNLMLGRKWNADFATARR